MSHELRTPLNGILGLTSLLAAAENVTTKQHEYLDMMKISGETLLHIINDILDISKIEAEKLELERIPIDIRKLFAETAQFFVPSATAKGLSLTWTMQENIPPLLLGDPVRIKQILTNFLGNAVKFTQHGAVSVQAELIESSDHDALVRCAVRDTGIGIPADKAGKLFRSFTQVDSSFTRKFGGTGLGLAIARNLAEMMGGRVDFESNEGQGSVFWFEMRLAMVQQSEVAITGAPTQSLERAQQEFQALNAQKPLRILLAEDSTVNQMVVMETLTPFGCTLELVHNGEEAVNLWRKSLVDGQRSSFDLVLMDVQMPKMDGLAATTIIRSQERAGAPIPIIGLTAHASAADHETCLEAGMDDVVTKPIDFACLFETMTRHVQQVQQVQQGIPTKDVQKDMPKDSQQGWPTAQTLASTSSVGSNHESKHQESNKQESKASGNGALPRHAVPPVNLRALYEAVNGKDEVIQKLINHFLLDYTQELAILGTAVQKRDTDLLTKTAHKLKSAVGNFGARRGVELCGQLEAVGRTATFDEAGALFQALEQEMEAVEESLSGGAWREFV
jgi:CheY-like chemotaxis protein